MFRVITTTLTSFHQLAVSITIRTKVDLSAQSVMKFETKLSLTPVRVCIIRASRLTAVTPSNKEHNGICQVTFNKSDSLCSDLSTRKQVPKIY